MNNETAQFIESFNQRNLQKLLQESFLEQIAMVDQLSSMDMEPEPLFQFKAFLSKDIPAFLDSYLKAQELSLKDMQDSLSQQATKLKDNLSTIYLDTTNSIKHDIHLQLKIIENKNTNIHKNIGSGVSPQLKSEVLEELETSISIETFQSLKEAGQQLLKANESSATWQNGFITQSQEQLKGKTLSTKSANTQQTATPNSIVLSNKQTSKVHLIVGILVIIAIGLAIIF